MKNWQKFASEHHNIIVMDDDTIKIENIAFSPSSKEYYDHVITKQEDGYFVEEFLHGTNNRVETYTNNTICEYLGY